MTGEVPKIGNLDTNGSMKDSGDDPVSEVYRLLTGGVKWYSRGSGP